MSQPFGYADTTFESFLHELPEDYQELAIEFKAFTRSRKMKTLLSRMMGEAAKPLLEGNLRFILVDGSSVQGPGATGTQYRLHLAFGLVRLHLVHAVFTDDHNGEHLDHYPGNVPDLDVDISKALATY